MPFRLQDGALPRAAPRAAYPRPFSRFFALAVWAGGLLTTVIRPQPCGLVSLRMGITQYSEVSAEYASLLVENYTNALRSVRKYDLEFFQPLAAPPNNHKSSKPTQRVQMRRAGRIKRRRFQKTNNELNRLQWGQVMDTARYRARRRGNNKIAPTRRRRRSRTVWDHGDSGELHRR